jgi:AcrR family transcriptional regulator
MTREPRQQAPPEPGASAAGGRDGLPADLRIDAVAVEAIPGSALGDGPKSAALSGDALGPEAAPAAVERPSLPSRGTGVRPRRPSLGGGIPAQGRELGAQGRQTVRRLLEAGLAEFDERGFQAVRVDDVVRRAKTSHGTFYLYFANKDDLFRTLLRDALRDMETITDDFPVVTSNDGGRAALRRWIQSFTDTYAAHATVIRILSQAEIVGEQVYGDGLRLLFRLSEAIAQGMTVASAGQRTDQPAKDPAQHAELTALACLMMLERINYLLSVDVRLPREEMVDRLSAIIYAAFHAP